ncbi:PRC-barrel domain-containing protein [Leisingera daeponensis]|uniref:PRC-barrel domain-containing protein n=1 Tax=Leisingera daeponensis TaxID=405746 RepID=A0ABS7NEX7_9RHOB|nr:PRC-barrel domain-containing protein [Leisingera daeponensis]MBY6139771.1 PRC-barrel domain-containing protein [Leisingera daeponensis]
MKHLMLSTSLIVAAAAPGLAGSQSVISGDAGASVQLETPAADLSAGATAMGEAKAESTPVQPGTEQPADNAESALNGGTASEGGLSALVPDADGIAMEPLGMNEVTADALTGAPAYDSKDEHIGELSQVVVNTNGGVEAVIIDVGGFLGMGEKPVELAMGDIEIVEVENDLRVITHLTREQLEALPDYQPG